MDLGACESQCSARAFGVVLKVNTRYAHLGPASHPEAASKRNFNVKAGGKTVESETKARICTQVGGIAVCLQARAQTFPAQGRPSKRMSGSLHPPTLPFWQLRQAVCNFFLAILASPLCKAQIGQHERLPLGME